MFTGAVACVAEVAELDGLDSLDGATGVRSRIAEVVVDVEVP